MQTNQLNRDKLRELARIKLDGAKVLSVYLNLDPSEFATDRARASEISSLFDEADRRLRDANGLTHDQLMSLREDVERVRTFLSGADFKGAHAMAVFASGPADLFEAVKLPRAVESELVINDTPYVEPLADIASTGDWAVLLVNRRMSRIFRGRPDAGFREVARLQDDVHGWHDQGGWSQSRYQRGIEKEVHDHMKRTADVLQRRLKSRSFERLLIGGPDETASAMCETLHPYVKERLAGRIDVDVENSNADQVAEAAAPIIEQEDRKHERAALDRLEEALATGGRGAAGLDDTLEELNQRRVEILLFEPGFTAPGVVCPRCGWVGTDASECPADGTQCERRDDIVEAAVSLAINQSADVIVTRFFDDLDGRGSIAAVLRF
jgi:peptide chain release factor subunit 1